MFQNINDLDFPKVSNVVNSVVQFRLFIKIGYEEQRDE